MKSIITFNVRTLGGTVAGRWIRILETGSKITLSLYLVIKEMKILQPMVPQVLHLHHLLRHQVLQQLLQLLRQLPLQLQSHQFAKL